ncbi:MAG TPA: phosphoserine phosphatase SerB [Kofleriaceae bacterium]|jgi:phosphoserine phosphatase|nr:phosphoserine phosphatase SerB [Kofleriaceae bacterium]
MSPLSGGRRVLVTVTGPDTPGITARLTGVIAGSHANLLDIEQVVVQRQLILGLLVGVDDPGSSEAVLKDLLFAAKTMGLDLQFTALLSADDGVEPGRAMFAVTTLGDAMDAGGVHKIATVLAEHGANIENIRRLSDGHLTSLEFMVSAAAAEDRVAGLRAALMAAAGEHDIDVALQRETFSRRAKRLVVMDMDSTLIQMEVIDELARLHGVGDEVADITRQAMGGELDYEQSLRKRVGLLRGMDWERVSRLARDLPITEGARDLLYVLRTLGYRTGVISGGFTFAALALKEQLGLDYAYANQLEVSEGKLTGRVLDPIITPQRKADLLDTIAQSEGIALAQTIAVGDGANDLPMLGRAGLGIAFHAKPKLKAAADTAVSKGGLDRILYLLGLRAREVTDILRGAPHR